MYTETAFHTNVLLIIFSKMHGKIVQLPNSIKTWRWYKGINSHDKSALPRFKKTPYKYKNWYKLRDKQRSRRPAKYNFS